MTSFVIKATELLVFCLPLIKLLIVIRVIAAAVISMLRARFIQQWLRVCTRIAGALLVLPLLLPRCS